MHYKKKIVCLADSRKHNARCFAGKEVHADGSFGEWIRPIGTSATGEIEPKDSVYNTGSRPHVLDIVSIVMKAPAPHGHQVENHRIDTGYYWQKVGTQSFDSVEDLEDEPEDIWLNGDSSSYHGLHDRVPKDVAASIEGSLLLIRPENVTIRVLTPGAGFSSSTTRAARARFEYRGTEYDIKITDPAVEQGYLTQPEGEYELDQDAFFCISLADSHTDGYCYKLVATMITEQPL